MPAKSNQSLNLKSAGKLPPWFWIGAIAIVAIAFLVRNVGGNTSGSGSTASSVVNSPNSPMAPVTSMGSNVDQLLPAGQLTPNEPGTAPIISANGGYQYGGN